MILPSRRQVRPSPAGALVATLVAVLLGVSTAVAIPAHAEDPVPNPSDPTKPLTRTDPNHPGATTAPELAGVAVNGTAASSAQADLDRAKGAVEDARRAKADLERQLADLGATRATAVDDQGRAHQAVLDAQAEVADAEGVVVAAQQVLADAQAARDQAQTSVEEAQFQLRAVAVANYTRQGTESLLDLLNADKGAQSVDARRRTMSRAAIDARYRTVQERFRTLQDRIRSVGDARSKLTAAQGALGTARDAEAAREQDERDATARIADIDGQIADTTARSSQASDTIGTRLVQQQGAARDLADARVLAGVQGADFPLVALDAYWRAAHRAPCKVEWWAIAGIGWVESKNGTEGGSRLDALGGITKPIIGIALNGGAGTARIPDTDGGTLDGDPVYDRAVGPMQFIPSTFKAFAVDGDGDGKSDPNDLYDASATTARYLCAGRPDLTGDVALKQAYLSYNQSEFYAASVLARAHDYQQRVAIPPLPPG